MTLARVFFRDLAPLLCVSLVALAACGGGAGTTSSSGGNNGNGGTASHWSLLPAASNMPTAGGAYEMATIPDGKIAALGADDAGTALWFFDTQNLSWSAAAAIGNTLDISDYGGGCIAASSGKVISTGHVYSAVPMKTAVYDYTNDSWSAGGQMIELRGGYQVVCLSDGTVLAAGGVIYDTPYPYNTETATASAEIYDPASGQWSAAAPMNYPREYFTLIALPDGRAMAIGGAVNPWTAAGADTEGSAEIYDPATDTWSLTGPLITPRVYADALVLDDGKVLVAGGANVEAGPLASAELYDPATNQWISTGEMQTSRWGSGMAQLTNGTVLVVGGSEPYLLISNGESNGQPETLVTPQNSATTVSADLFDPATMTWSDAGSMSKGRSGPAVIALPDGGAVACGGGDATGLGTLYATCERYTP